jgi:hypothetical protein
MALMLIPGIDRESAMKMPARERVRQHNSTAGQE